jgi:hypothetical protein
LRKPLANVKRKKKVCSLAALTVYSLFSHDLSSDAADSNSESVENGSQGLVFARFLKVSLCSIIPLVCLSDADQSDEDELMRPPQDDCSSYHRSDNEMEDEDIPPPMTSQRQAPREQQNRHILIHQIPGDEEIRTALTQRTRNLDKLNMELRGQPHKFFKVQSDKSQTSAESKGPVIVVAFRDWVQSLGL